MPDGNQWHLSAGVDLVWREWDGESVAYERFSGDLHCFDTVTAAVLKLLAQGSNDETALVSEISQTLALEPDHDLTLFVKQSLGRLSGLGLVERG
jgi:PqqD family protein of HPr-rel-A system